MSKENQMQKVKELIELMKQNELIEIEISDGESKIMLRRPQPAQAMFNGITAAGQSAVVMPQAVQQGVPMVQAQISPDSGAQANDDDMAKIESPMVGTFYSAPSPDAEPFIKVGSQVDADTVVCIVEAMKVMNEIKAEMSGTVTEVLCKAGEAVEFGQVLFKVKA